MQRANVQKMLSNINCSCVASAINLLRFGGDVHQCALSALIDSIHLDHDTCMLGILHTRVNINASIHKVINTGKYDVTEIITPIDTAITHKSIKCLKYLLLCGGHINYPLKSKSQKVINVVKFHSLNSTNEWSNVNIYVKDLIETLINAY